MPAPKPVPGARTTSERAAAPGAENATPRGPSALTGRLSTKTGTPKMRGEARTERLADEIRGVRRGSADDAGVHRPRHADPDTGDGQATRGERSAHALDEPLDRDQRAGGRGGHASARSHRAEPRHRPSPRPRPRSSSRQRQPRSERSDRRPCQGRRSADARSRGGPGFSPGRPEHWGGLGGHFRGPPLQWPPHHRSSAKLHQRDAERRDGGARGGRPQSHHLRLALAPVAASRQVGVEPAGMRHELGDAVRQRARRWANVVARRPVGRRDRIRRRSDPAVRSPAERARVRAGGVLAPARPHRARARDVPGRLRAPADAGRRGGGCRGAWARGGTTLRNFSTCALQPRRARHRRSPAPPRGERRARSGPPATSDLPRVRGEPRVRFTCSPTPSPLSREAGEPGCGRGSAVASTVVLVTMPWRCAARMPSLTPRVRPPVVGVDDEAAAHRAPRPLDHQPLDARRPPGRQRRPRGSHRAQVGRCARGRSAGRDLRSRARAPRGASPGRPPPSRSAVLMPRKSKIVNTRRPRDTRCAGAPRDDAIEQAPSRRARRCRARGLRVLAVGGPAASASGAGCCTRGRSARPVTGA